MRLTLQSTGLGFLALCLLAACTTIDTTGISAKSSKPPKGSPSAAVTVMEYGDLQCPACKAAHELLTKPLLKKYGTRIRFEFRQFPLRQIHQYAFTAAQASECAADQGKFWEYLDLNYTNQDDLKNAPEEKWAVSLGLEADLFHRCLASGIKADAVLAEYDEGQQRGVQGTPSYFVNDTQVKTNTIDEMSSLIDAALKTAKSAPL